MRFNKLDLNLLVALDALLTEVSISRAAERLHMSQSAMSNALARLREYFDDELLVQVGRRMEPTPQAEVLKDAVHDVLLRIDSSITARPKFIPAQSERAFRIFVSDFTLATLMPYVLARAHVQGSKIRFEFLAQDHDPARALERSEVDMLVMPRDYCTADHPTEDLFRERFQCVLWKDSKLSDGPLTLDRYANAGHVVMQPSSGKAPSLEAWFIQRHGMSRRAEVASFSFASTPALVVGTERIATVHSRLARQATRNLPLVIREVPLAMPEMQQVMQWHRYRTRDPGIEWLRGVFQAATLDMDSLSPSE